MKADVGDRIDDDLAVELQHHPQHAVGAGMVRPEIQEEEIGPVAAPLHPPLFRIELKLLLFLHHLSDRAMFRPSSVP
ncbi:MAG: hypothetical protein MPW15_02065 [Candidatus Manganitrophus sp.]|nr:hypothetical protein [Candidatus Manganitrophus sp.]